MSHTPVKEFVSLYKWLKVLNVSKTDGSEYEGLTLKRLYEEACKGYRPKALLYFHTKGISFYAGIPNEKITNPVATRRSLRAVNSWRHYMEWAVLDRWKDAVEALDNHQVCGVNYLEIPWPHFSGNFWWARSDYIQTLPNPVMGKRPLERIYFEQWMGLGNPRAFSFGDAQCNLSMVPGDRMPGDPSYFYLYQHDVEPYYHYGHQVTKTKLSERDFLRVEMARGIHHNNPSFVSLCKQTVEQIAQIAAIKTVLDFGCGTGVYAREFQNSGYGTYAYDSSSVTRAYLKKTLPELKVLAAPHTTDLMAWIEVAEHMTDAEIDGVFAEVDPKYILFSSTSSRSVHDVEWGRINLKSQEEWIRLLECKGYRLLKELPLPTAWTKVFQRIG